MEVLERITLVLFRWPSNIQRADAVRMPGKDDLNAMSWGKSPEKKSSLPCPGIVSEKRMRPSSNLARTKIDWFEREARTAEDCAIIKRNPIKSGLWKKRF